MSRFFPHGVKGGYGSRPVHHCTLHIERAGLCKNMVADTATVLNRIVRDGARSVDGFAVDCADRGDKADGAAFPSDECIHDAEPPFTQIRLAGNGSCSRALGPLDRGLRIWL